MKIIVPIITSLFLTVLLTGCNFNYSEGGKEINLEKDAKELSIAKKSLQFIEQDKTDSLRELFNPEVMQIGNPEQLEWLFEKGKRIIKDNEYPNDSMITVSTITQKSISGEETFKEFSLPFINKSNPDSTMYFKITIANGEIIKFMLSTGMQFIN